MNKKSIYAYVILYVLLLILSVKGFNFWNFGLVTTAFFIYGLLLLLGKKGVVNIMEKILIVILLFPFITFGVGLAKYIGKNNGVSITNLIMTVVNFITYIYMIFVLITKNKNKKINSAVMLLYLVASVVVMLIPIFSKTIDSVLIYLLKSIISIVMHLLMIKIVYEVKKV